ESTGDLIWTYCDGPSQGTLLDDMQQDVILSDCQPIAYQDGILWYTTYGDAPVFYQIRNKELSVLAPAQTEPKPDNDDDDKEDEDPQPSSPAVLDTVRFFCSSQLKVPTAEYGQRETAS